MTIGDARYVLLTSFKRDGTGVATPVWIAPLPGGRLGFTTSTATWKTKRIRRTPRVTLQECSARGTPTPGAPVLEGAAAVHTEGPEMEVVRRAIRRKYGIQPLLISAAQWLLARIRRSFPGNDAVVTLTLADPSW